MKKYFICIFLLIFMHEQLEAQTESSDVIEFSPEVFSYRDVKDITEPVQMRWTENGLDLSSIVQSMERAKESQYRGALWKMADNFVDLFHGVKVLCRQSSQPKNCIERGKKTLLEAYKDVDRELSSRVTYPYRYPDDISHLTQASDSLDSECPACTDLNVTFAIMKSSEAQYNQLYNKIKEKDKKCQKDIIHTLSNFMRFGMALPKNCQNDRNQSHPICKTILNDIEILRNRFPDLTQLVYEKDISEQTEAQSTCLECLQISRMGYYRWARSQFDFLEGLTSCSDLNVEEKRTHYLERVYGGSYTIKKDSDKNYSINLVMEFFPDSNYEGPVSREKVPDYYMEKVQDCMQEANTKMLGPNGEKLHINIRKPPKVKSCGIKNTRVAIRPPNERSGVLHYSSDVGCSTVLHEIFHLLGLPDEYALGNPCRVEVPESIMSQDADRWSAVFDTETRDSLLDPAHFNSILYKNCTAKNKLYDDCLRRSEDWPRRECRKRKQECESKNLTGRNKQREIEIARERLNRARQNHEEAKKMREVGRTNIKKLIAELRAGKHGEKGRQAIAFWEQQLEQSDQLDEGSHLIELEERLKAIESW